MYDSTFIENCFDNLVNSFNTHNLYDFLSSIYLANTEDVSYIGSLEKLIYTIGDTDEIYTQNERKYIETIKNVIMFSPFYLEGKKSKVLCNIISVKMPESSDSIYSNIAFMKICNKALKSFNVYLIVSNEAIYIGQDSLENINILDCKLSYPIMSNIDWDKLEDIFLYIDTKNFQIYYNSLLDAITSVCDCYEDSSLFIDEPYYFDEKNDNYVLFSYNYLNNQIYSNTCSKLKSDFESDVQNSKNSLSYIKTNKVNSLELLMDAENVEQKSNEKEITIQQEATKNKVDTSINESMLDDPEALIKLLKNKNIPRI